MTRGARGMILGITGGIAAGKSMVADLFRQLGAEVVSADQLARQAVEPGSPVLERLGKTFGKQILTTTGALDRKALAERIFPDPEARRNLNRIIHPAIAALAETKLRAAAEKNRLVIYEAPLLFEVGAEKRVDAVLVVRVDDDLQLRRLMRRDGLSEQEARQRIAAQLPQAEKIARADYLIDNSGDREETATQVRALFRRLSEDSG